jgi:hypothetical protein
MSIKDKVKGWLISHVAHPELLTDADMKGIDFVLTFVPEFAKIIIEFSLLSAVYLFLINKYGFNRTIILLMVSIIFSIGQVGKSVRDLGK